MLYSSYKITLITQLIIKVASCCSWSRVLSHICGTEDVPVPSAQAGKLRDKDRHLIKERFAVSLRIWHIELDQCLLIFFMYLQVCRLQVLKSKIAL
jgi:hypothetical protein